MCVCVKSFGSFLLKLVPSRGLSPVVGYPPPFELLPERVVVTVVTI